MSLHVLNYPDVSTVDHIERILSKKPSRVSIGGNCLFVITRKCDGFFPFIYNDDWFFIFKNMTCNRVLSVGIAKQRPHKPWESPTRIKFEQFGDIIIEGVKSNIRLGELPFRTSIPFWEKELVLYLKRLRGLMTKASTLIILDRLNSAFEIASSYTPNQLHSFVTSYNSSHHWRVL